MKKISLVLILCILSALAFATPAAAAAPSPGEIISDAAILIDADTGQILYEKNMHRRMYPASVTKIMTALLTVEEVSPYEMTTVSQSAVDIDEPNSANIALRPGEQITVESALYALMLPSANDAANVLAEHVAGNQQAFARMMTERAREIGAVNTNFSNAHGLHEPDHYTTAYDMALITRHAMDNEEFARYFGASHYTMTPTNLQPQERPFTNYQYMLNSTTGYYDSRVVGGKVGYTTEAQHTMSTVATQDGRTLICVVMHSPHRGNKFSDTEKLLDYGFSAFYPYTITGREFVDFSVPIGDESAIYGIADFTFDQDVTVLLPLEVVPESVQLHYNYPDLFDDEESVTASIVLQLDEEVAGMPDVLLDLPVEASITIETVPVIASGPSTRVKLPNFLDTFLSGTYAAIAVLLLGIVSLCLLLVGIRHRNLQKRRKERLARLARRNRIYEARSSAVRSNIYHSSRRSS